MAIYLSYDFIVHLFSTDVKSNRINVIVSVVGSGRFSMARYLGIIPTNNNIIYILLLYYNVSVSNVFFSRRIRYNKYTQSFTTIIIYVV